MANICKTYFNSEKGMRNIRHTNALYEIFTSENKSKQNLTLKQLCTKLVILKQQLLVTLMQLYDYLWLEFNYRWPDSFSVTGRCCLENNVWKLTLQGL